MARPVSTRDIGEVLLQRLPISAMHVGKLLVWQIGKSDTPSGAKACFSGITWNDNLPWVDDEVWIDRR